MALVDRRSLVLDTESTVFIIKCIAALESRVPCVASEVAAKLFCRAMTRATQFVKARSSNSTTVLSLVSRMAGNVKLLALADDDAVTAVQSLEEVVIDEAGAAYYAEWKDKSKSTLLKVGAWPCNFHWGGGVTPCVVCLTR